MQGDLSKNMLKKHMKKINKKVASAVNHLTMVEGRDITTLKAEGTADAVLLVHFDGDITSLGPEVLTFRHCPYALV